MKDDNPTPTKPKGIAMGLPLSIFLITYNEADRIDRTLAAVLPLLEKGAELVIVDSGSNDETVSLAKKYTTNIIIEKFRGYGPQKRLAEDHCKNDWLLNIDADEVLPLSLAEEISQVLQSPQKDAYTIGIAEIFPGEKHPHPLAYKLYPVRLYKKSKGRYANSSVHDRVALNKDASTGKLKGTIHHFSVRSIGEQLEKLNRYSTLQAEDLMTKTAKPSLLRLLTEFPVAFLKAYLLRRHLVHGRFGLMWAMNYAFYRYLRIAKHHEAWAMRQKTEAPNE